jgi:hypothetical protein
VRGLPAVQRGRDGAGKADFTAIAVPLHACRQSRSFQKLSVEDLLCTENGRWMKIWGKLSLKAMEIGAQGEPCGGLRNGS